MPCSTSSTRRREPVAAPSAKSRSWRSDSSSPSANERRLALASCRRRSPGVASVAMRGRGRPGRAGAAGVGGHASIIAASSQHPGARRGSNRRPCRRCRRSCGSSNHSPCGEPGLGQHPQGRGVAVVGRREVGRRRPGTGAGSAPSTPTAPGRRARGPPTPRAERVVDADRVGVGTEQRRSRGSRRSGSPARTRPSGR